MIDENQVKRIVGRALDDRENLNAFSVSLIPYHAHTGIDSPPIDYINLLNQGLPKVTSIVSATAITPNVASENLINITALAVTGAFKNPLGNPVNGQKLELRITSSNTATARDISFTSATGGYVGASPALPSSTVTGQTMMLGFMYDTNGGVNKWRLWYSSSA